MGKLADIASFAVKKTGIFHNTQTKQISGSTMPTGSKVVVLNIWLSVKYFICLHIALLPDNWNFIDSHVFAEGNIFDDNESICVTIIAV